MNLSKEESLYNEGLRPLLYSIEDAKKRAVGWRRCGENIAYYRNDSSYVFIILGSLFVQIIDSINNNNNNNFLIYKIY